MKPCIVVRTKLENESCICALHTELICPKATRVAMSISLSIRDINSSGIVNKVMGIVVVRKMKVISAFCDSETFLNPPPISHVI